MISIVVCSINDMLITQVSSNIDRTIKVDYEMLVWNNREANLGICEVYNKMAAMAKYEIICFVHEDVLFETIGWGKLILEYFTEYPDVGLIGVAGSNYKSHSLSGWYTGDNQYDCFNITHRYPDKDEKLRSENFAGKTIQQVVCLDGVFLCTKKSLWEKVKFNQDQLKGFHFYDIDFSLRINQISKVVVVDNVDMVHITKGGDFGKAWVTTAILFHKLWQNQLPKMLNEAILVKEVEINIVKTWLNWLKNYAIDIGLKNKWIFSQKLFLKPELWYSILRFYLYKPLKINALRRFLKKK